MKRNVALEIGPMTSPLSNVDDDVIYFTTQFYTIYYNETSNLRQYLYELNHMRRQEMTEEQCHRPSDRDAERKRKRTTGWLAGHTIHLEIEEVIWIK